VFQAVEQECKWKNPADVRKFGRYNLVGIPADLKGLFSDAYSKGARIHSNSWGGGDPGSYDDQCRALDQFVWEHKDFCVVAAAGNDGPHAATVTTPGADPFVLTVGALDDRGTVAAGDDRESPFTSRGPTLDGFAKPDVLAPGERVLSLRARGSALDNPAPGIQDGNASLYARMSGTSVASAMVSGVAALVLAAHPRYTTTQVKGAIVGGAHRVTGSRTPGVDAALALVTHPDRVNALLMPSRLLLEMLARNGVKLESVSWEEISWEAVSWEAVSWEGVAWEGVNWESVAWESHR
jgi:hypothetical protein